MTKLDEMRAVEAALMRMLDELHDVVLKTDALSPAAARKLERAFDAALDEADAAVCREMMRGDR